MITVRFIIKCFGKYGNNNHILNNVQYAETLFVKVSSIQDKIMGIGTEFSCCNYTNTFFMKITKIIAAIFLCYVCSCTTIPKGAQAVKPFDSKQYLGKWYEIARLDYRWERNLNNVTATYTLRNDGFIKVDNKGYNVKKEKWEESIGKAKPVAEKTEGKLKVAFWGAILCWL